MYIFADLFNICEHSWNEEQELEQKLEDYNQGVSGFQAWAIPQCWRWDQDYSQHDSLSLLVLDQDYSQRDRLSLLVLVQDLCTPNTTVSTSW
jgi:hypothetical protein